MSFALEGKRGRRGEFIPYRLQWQTADTLLGWIFALRLRPVSPSAAWDRLAERGYFQQEFKPVYGLSGLPPSPAGQVYEQEGKLFIPNNAPPGRYTIELGIGQRSPDFSSWTPLTTPGELLLDPAPQTPTGRLIKE